MSAVKTLSLVVPCKNEFGRLRVGEFVRAAEQWPWLSFCFVDDGSTDATADSLAWLANASPSMHVIYLPENRGKAEAVRAGVSHLCDVSHADLIGFWDADLATPLDEIPCFVRKFDENPSITAVLGSRWQHLGAHVRRSAGRNLAGAVVKAAIRRILDVPVWDTQCGAKIFRRDIAAEIFDRPFLTRWLFDVELLVRMGRQRLHTQVCELPVSEWHDVPGSKLGFRSSLSIIRELAICANLICDRSTSATADSMTAEASLRHAMALGDPIRRARSASAATITGK